MVSVAVSDPTMARAHVPVLPCGRQRVISADESVHVSRIPGGTLLRVETTQTYCRSHAATPRS
jgi:hypothetical protein